MGVDSSLQDTLDSEQIAFTDTLGEEIETVIDGASRLQRYEYVVGEIVNYRVPDDHVYFDLIHEGSPLHCVIFASRRPAIPTEIDNGMQVAVAGDLTFHQPKNHCSIEVEAVVLLEADSSRQIPTRRQLTLVALLLIVLVLVGYLMLG